MTAREDLLILPDDMRTKVPRSAVCGLQGKLAPPSLPHARRTPAARPTFTRLFPRFYALGDPVGSSGMTRPEVLCLVTPPEDTLQPLLHAPAITTRSCLSTKTWSCAGTAVFGSDQYSIRPWMTTPLMHRWQGCIPIFQAFLDEHFHHTASTPSYDAPHFLFLSGNVPFAPSQTVRRSPVVTCLFSSLFISQN